MEHIEAIRQELEIIRSELVTSKAESSILRERASEQEAELNTLQVTVNEYSSIIQQQKKEIDKLKQKTENCEPFKKGSSIANRLI